MVTCGIKKKQTNKSLEVNNSDIYIYIYIYIYLSICYSLEHTANYSPTTLFRSIDVDEVIASVEKENFQLLTSKIVIYSLFFV
jgi:hypothetical protein